MSKVRRNRQHRYVLFHISWQRSACQVDGRPAYSAIAPAGCSAQLRARGCFSITDYSAAPTPNAYARLPATGLCAAAVAGNARGAVGADFRWRGTVDSGLQPHGRIDGDVPICASWSSRQASRPWRPLPSRRSRRWSSRLLPAPTPARVAASTREAAPTQAYQTCAARPVRRLRKRRPVHPVTAHLRRSRCPVIAVERTDEPRGSCPRPGDTSTRRRASAKCVDSGDFGAASRC